MRKLVLFLTLLLAAAPALAQPVSTADEGVYVVVSRSGTPAGVYFHLYRRQGIWVMDARHAGQRWINISCDPGCRYHRSTPAEIDKYIPPDLLARNDVGCIQNAAQAFCRFNPKGRPEQARHIIISLVSITGEPAPLFLRRLSGPPR